MMALLYVQNTNFRARRLRQETGIFESAKTYRNV